VILRLTAISGFGQEATLVVQAQVDRLLALTSHSRSNLKRFATQEGTRLLLSPLSTTLDLSRRKERRRKFGRQTFFNESSELTRFTARHTPRRIQHGESYTRQLPVIHDGDDRSRF
jgi:hypothetical protein